METRPQTPTTEAAPRRAPSPSPSPSPLSSAAALLVALAMLAAAVGSGSTDTPPEAKLPASVDMLANVVAAAIGILVLWPRTRGAASIAAAALMVLSMIANYSVDGADFFLRALPFNLTTLLVSLLLARHHLRA